MDPATPGPRPVDSLAGVVAYRSPPPATPVDLKLDGNEGAGPAPQLLRTLDELGADVLRLYPDPWSFEQRLAGRLGLDADRVLVTAGGDDAIDRACRAFLEPGRELILPVPTFEMIPRYAALAGATTRRVDWAGGAFPIEAVLAARGPATGMIAVVSPNNPTGAVASADDLARLSAAAPNALLLVDLAYTEFAERDLTGAALKLPNALVVRSLSKAWGLAGLRVGYALAGPGIIAALRAAGGPYAVSRPSLALAQARLERDAESVTAFVARVCAERGELVRVLADLGLSPTPSQGNFVLARVADPTWIRQALAGLGIAVRAWPGRAGLDDRVRITCPGDPDAFGRLVRALGVIRAPQALLLDLDGVLADVSRSYREAIRQTAASFGVELGPGDIAAAKAAPDSNNDWRMTHRLLAERGVETSLDEVTRRFEAAYQGEPGRPGLRERERLIPDAGLLDRLAGRLKLAVVTGRPRADAEDFLGRAGVGGLFDALVCMQDAPAKPDPAPVRLACERLGVERAWMIGDTPDDVRAARAAGALPLGVTAPGDDPATAGANLLGAGAGRVLIGLQELEELLP